MVTENTAAANDTVEAAPDNASHTDNKQKVSIPQAEGTVDATVEEVRQGHTGDHVRHILLISTAAAAVALAAFFLFWLF